jgi:hypothetical protein
MNTIFAGRNVFYYNLSAKIYRFGKIEDEKMILNDAGKMVEKWTIPNLFWANI